MWTFIALAVMFVVQVMGTMVMYAPSILAPAAHVDIGVSASSVGVLSSICYGGAIAATIISGQAIARFGPLRWSQFCLLMLACSTGLIASGNLLLVVMGGLILGAGYGPLTPASSTILVKRVPEQLRATILSIKQTGVPAAGVLTGAIIPSLILLFSWKVAILILGGMCVLLAALIQPTREEFDHGDLAVSPVSKQSIVESLKMLSTDPRLREIGLMSFMYSGMQMMFVSFFVVYLTEHVGFTLLQAGGAMAVGMIAGILARVLWGVISDQLAKPRIILGWLGLGTSAATVTMALITPDWPLFVVYGVGIVMGITAMAWNGVFLAEVANIAPRGDVGMATSASLMVSFGGVVVLPALCWGMITATGSYTIMFLIMAAINVLPATLLLCRRV